MGLVKGLVVSLRNIGLCTAYFMPFYVNIKRIRKGKGHVLFSDYVI